MGSLLRCKCVFCGRSVLKKSSNGKTPDHKPICSRKSCKKARS